MRLLSKVLKIVIVLAAVWGCAWMAGKLGPWKALGVWAAIFTVLCTVIPLALARQSAGKITVMNFLMGYILQWGYRIGQGKLIRIAMISWGIWMLLGTAAVLATRVHANAFATGLGADAQNRGATIMVLLTLAWIIDGAALCYLLGIVLAGRRLASLGPVLAVLLLMIGVSMGLVIYNHTATTAKIALLVAGGPILLLGLLYGLFVINILVAGRTTRWN